MKQKSWLNYITIFAISLTIISIIAGIALGAFEGLLYKLGLFFSIVFWFWPVVLIIVGILLYALIAVFVFNYLALPQGKSDWSLPSAATVLLLLCSLSLVLIVLLTR